MHYQHVLRHHQGVKPKIIVGMSGGVDSSLTAWRLKQDGFPVEGLFMKNWQDDDDCPAAVDLADAARVCDTLKITLHTVNFSQEYWHHVFDQFLTEYEAGRTPNPDILCNKEIKFKAFLDYAKTLGAEYIATGHYAQNNLTDTGKYQLCCALDQNKDQTYFLYTLTQQQLKHVLFPIGDLPKQQVRDIAAQQGLITHNKKDSTGICFIGERKFREFLHRYVPAKPGVIQTLTGETIGEHQGVMYYTRGQRQGLGIGGLKSHSENPWYVVGKNVEQNIVFVAQGHDHPALFHQTLTCQQIHWVDTAPSFPFQCQAKIRYRHGAQHCCIHDLGDGQYRVDFADPQWAITPGQSIVFYQDKLCLGGAVIESYA